MSRPISAFRGFVGQTGPVKFLLRQLHGAKAREEPAPPILLAGPSGVGKSLLAACLAAEYGTSLVRSGGHATSDELEQQLRSVVFGDFVFIDEAHHLREQDQEILCQLIDDSRLGPCSGDAGMPPCTPVLATNRPGRLLDALLKRVPVQLVLDLYSPREMRAVVDRLATDCGLLLTPQARNKLARVSLGLPRRARHLVDNFRRHLSDSEARQLSVADVGKFLAACGVDQAGLEDVDRRYLQILDRLGTASLQSLGLSLGLDSAFLRQQVEPRLLRAGLMKITGAGRRLTNKGHRRKEQLDERQGGTPAD